MGSLLTMLVGLMVVVELVGYAVDHVDCINSLIVKCAVNC
jgi:hypothetical protein